MLKVQAEVAALALKGKMRGKGWKTRVWENMGWNFDVHNGPVQVYPSTDGYEALIGEDGGLGCWTHSGEAPFKDPNDAVRFAVKNARKQLDRCIKMVKSAEKALGEKRKGKWRT